MTITLCALPIAVVVLLMASGRAGSVHAGLCGALVAIAVATTAAPIRLAPVAALAAGAKGLWLSALVGLVILAGLLFRDIVSGIGEPAGVPSDTRASGRRTAFAACFLVGPFAESATGFGVGQVAVVALLRPLGLSPLDTVLLALFSQTLVPWGAMASGTIIGSDLSGVSARELGTHCAVLSVPLLLAWLGLFWRLAPAMGLRGTAREMAGELAWVAAALGLLVLGNQVLGPEIAGMAALGPLIVLRFMRDERPDRQRWRAALRVGLPYAALILGLAASRGIPALSAILGGLAVVRPFADAPPWSPWLHPASWLTGVGAIVALLSGRPGLIAPAARRSWAAGRKAVLTIAIYLVLARVMAESGMADALASRLQTALGAWAVLTTPLLAGAFGFLTGSGNATNGLLMVSQASLAANAPVTLAWLAAIQNTAAAGMTMLSPVRVAMGCALVGRMDLERATYARAWPLGAATMLVLSGAALALVIASRA